jgi:hypothetical protein
VRNCLRTPDRVVSKGPYRTRHWLPCRPAAIPSGRWLFFKVVQFWEVDQERDLAALSTNIGPFPDRRD